MGWYVFFHARYTDYNRQFLFSKSVDKIALNAVHIQAYVGYCVITHVRIENNNKIVRVIKQQWERSERYDGKPPVNDIMFEMKVVYDVLWLHMRGDLAYCFTII